MSPSQQSPAQVSLPTFVSKTSAIQQPRLAHPPLKSLALLQILATLPLAIQALDVSSHQSNVTMEVHAQLILAMQQVDNVFTPQSQDAILPLAQIAFQPILASQSVVSTDNASPLLSFATPPTSVLLSFQP